jgi:hypothetical protein
MKNVVPLPHSTRLGLHLAQSGIEDAGCVPTIIKRFAVLQQLADVRSCHLSDDRLQWPFSTRSVFNAAVYASLAVEIGCVSSY